MDDKTTIENRLKILPEKLQALIVDGSWGDKASEISKQFKLDDKKYINFEDEIFYVLLCFEPKSKFTENIKRELGIEQNLAEQITSEVEKNIFSKVVDDLNAIEKKIKETSKKPQVVQPASKIGESFEQIILNQARAMQPARPTGESVAGGPARAPGEVPQNLPTHPSQNSNPIQKPSTPAPQPSTEPQQNATHDYLPGQDPYREPLE